MKIKETITWKELKVEIAKLKRSKNKEKVFFLAKITPKDAQEILAKYKGLNRDLTTSKISKMANCGWDHNLTTILRFNTDGLLIDGQHRLTFIASRPNDEAFIFIVECNSTFSPYMDSNAHRSGVENAVMMEHIPYELAKKEKTRNGREVMKYLSLTKALNIFASYEKRGDGIVVIPKMWQHISNSNIGETLTKFCKENEFLFKNGSLFKKSAPSMYALVNAYMCGIINNKDIKNISNFIECSIEKRRTICKENKSLKGFYTALLIMENNKMSMSKGGNGGQQCIFGIMHNAIKVYAGLEKPSNININDDLLLMADASNYRCTGKKYKEEKDNNFIFDFFEDECIKKTRRRKSSKREMVA